MEEFYRNCVFYGENGNQLDEFCRNVEHGTRYLIQKYIKPDHKVLELGARYGTVSICLDYLLQNPSQQLVCVDPDFTIEHCLRQNKEINHGSFNIFIGAISKKEQYVCHNGCVWETKTYVTPPTSLSCKKIKTITLTDLQKLYHIFFDVLVADCEGFLMEFILENDDFFENLNIVIYEEDGGKDHPINGVAIDYNDIETILLSKGFVLQETFVDFIGLKNKIWIKNANTT